MAGLSDRVRKTLERSREVTRLDDIINLFTGLGTSRDKGSQFQIVPGQTLTSEECESLFHFDDFANRIVSAVPDEALRQGFTATLTVEEDTKDRDSESVKKATKAVNERLAELDVVSKVHEAMVWGRCFGGAALVIGADDGRDPRLPLNEEGIRSLEFFTVVDRRELLPYSWYQSPREAKYGEVKTFLLQPITAGAVSISSTEIHETRLVTFRGALTSRVMRQRNQWWHHSVLQKLVNILKKGNGGFESVLSMIQDMSQAVYKLKGLIEAVSGGDAESLRERMELVDTLRSSLRAIILDADEEDFKLVERSSVAGLEGLVDKIFLRIAAAARMPVSILMGQAPAGLNATGAMDLRWWYDTVRTAQDLELRPRLRRIIQMVAGLVAPGTDLQAWDVKFPNLWQMTDQEQAELRGKVAETDSKYIQSGVLLAEEVALTRFGRGEYCMDYEIDVEARRIALETELERMENPPDPNDPANQPPNGGPNVPPNGGRNPSPPGPNGSIPQT